MNDLDNVFTEFLWGVSICLVIISILLLMPLDDKFFEKKIEETHYIDCTNVDIPKCSEGMSECGCYSSWDRVEEDNTNDTSYIEQDGHYLVWDG